MSKLRRIARRVVVSGFSLPTALAVASPSATPEPIDRAAKALTAGMAAEASKNSNPSKGRVLAQSAQVLEALGAQPAMKGDSDLAARWRYLSREPAAAPLRGRGLGPGYRRMRIAPSQALALEQIFMGGELARIVVAPGPGARLTLSVTDRDGQTICRTQVSTNPGACDWTPVFTSRHRFEVRSTGKSPADFVLLTN